VKEAFARLVAHVDGHFRDEEALLEKAGYPQLKAHAQAHARLRARALELQKAADAGAIPFGPVIDFLANEVVARHLFTADRDFYPLFAGSAGSA
jgi:hemerythrin-like metal-binding protein